MVLLYHISLIGKLNITNFQELIFFSFRGAFAHGFLVDYLLKPLAGYYHKKGKSECYVVELVQLDVKHLLKVFDDDENDIKVVDSFTLFLRNFVSKNRRCISFYRSETFQKIKVSVCFSN